MSSYEHHVDKVIKNIAKPPFRFPNETNSNTTESILQLSESPTNFIELNNTLKNGTQLIKTPPEEHVKFIQLINDTIVEQYNEITTFRAENSNDTLYVIDEGGLIDAGKTNVTNVKIDWAKADMDIIETIHLGSTNDRFVPFEPEKAETPLAVILTSMIGILVILAIVILALYKNYKRRDNYNLATGRRGPKPQAREETALDNESQNERCCHGHAHQLAMPSGSNSHIQHHIEYDGREHDHGDLNDDHDDEFEVDFNNKNLYRF